jgi:hypothetical protein
MVSLRFAAARTSTSTKAADCSPSRNANLSADRLSLPKSLRSCTFAVRFQSSIAVAQMVPRNSCVVHHRREHFSHATAWNCSKSASSHSQCVETARSEANTESEISTRSKVPVLLTGAIQGRDAQHPITCPRATARCCLKTNTERCRKGVWINGHVRQRRYTNVATRLQSHHHDAARAASAPRRSALGPSSPWKGRRRCQCLSSSLTRPPSSQPRKVDWSASHRGSCNAQSSVRTATRVPKRYTFCGRCRCRTGVGCQRFGRVLRRRRRRAVPA